MPLGYDIARCTGQQCPSAANCRRYTERILPKGVMAPVLGVLSAPRGWRQRPRRVHSGGAGEHVQRMNSQATAALSRGVLWNDGWASTHDRGNRKPNMRRQQGTRRTENYRTPGALALRHRTAMTN